MTVHATLQELARQIRHGTLNILEAAQPAWLLFAPPGTSNHIAWHAGHALWLQDLLCVELLTGSSELPSDWADLFGMNCRPVADTHSWPEQTQLIGLLTAQLNRMLQLIETTSVQQLTSIANPARGPASIADRIIHGLHDEAKHCGEMYLLSKLCSAAGE